MSYELSAPRFTVESEPSFPNSHMGRGRFGRIAWGSRISTFDKTALTWGQVFRVYFYERGGSRNYVLTLGAKDVNGARRLN